MCFRFIGLRPALRSRSIHVYAIHAVRLTLLVPIVLSAISIQTLSTRRRHLTILPPLISGIHLARSGAGYGSAFEQLDMWRNPFFGGWRTETESGMGTGHRFAFFCTAIASFCAALAVIHIVFTTFVATCAENFRAQPAEPFREVGITWHELGCQKADICAIAIEADAAFHHFDVFFLQAGGGAVFAFLSALKTSLNTMVIMLVSHM